MPYTASSSIDIQVMSIPNTDNGSGHQIAQGEQSKTAFVQRLRNILPKEGFDYGDGAPPFDGTMATGYVVYAMKLYLNIKPARRIFPTFVDRLIGETFRQMFERVHTIKRVGHDAFWDVVCRTTPWSCKSPGLINGRIIEELAAYMMESRLRFKKSGAHVHAGKLGDTANCIDNYLDRLIKFDLPAYIPVIDPDDDDLDKYDEDHDYDENEVDDDDVLRVQKETECDLAVLYEHAGVYDQMICDEQYEPSWDENCDLVQLPADYPDRDGRDGEESTYAPMDLDYVDDEFMDATKKQRISEDQDSVPTSTSAQASSGEHKSEERMNQETAELVTMMKSTTLNLGRKRKQM
ncbi:hypothetical protein GE09DRAFT_1065655 [Coniochaeta sp. 2T2.1]|nr:hypothetical protein GE09DRAFT_1065655 [Coniochaeta sp. 2T2.1]